MVTHLCLSYVQLASRSVLGILLFQIYIINRNWPIVSLHLLVFLLMIMSSIVK